MEACVRRKRRVCSYCMEELSHASFYRHLQDKSGAICPGKRQISSCTFNDESSESSDDETSLTDELDISFRSELSDNYLEDTFDFGTESDNSSHGRDDNYSGSNFIATCNTAVPLVNTQDTIMSSDRSSDDHFESDGEEIWEDSCPEIDSDREDTNIMTNNLAKRILLGILTFITSVQLSFHASERAMSALLLFLKTFITYLANIINHLKKPLEIAASTY